MAYEPKMHGPPQRPCRMGSCRDKSALSGRKWISWWFPCRAQPCCGMRVERP